MVKFFAHVSTDEGVTVFYELVKAHLETCDEKGLVADVQYQATAKANGWVVFSACILGRVAK